MLYTRPLKYLQIKSNNVQEDAISSLNVKKKSKKKKRKKLGWGYPTVHFKKK